jgi:hypothetical protein
MTILLLSKWKQFCSDSVAYQALIPTLLSLTNTAELLFKKTLKITGNAQYQPICHGRWQTLLRPSSRSLSVCALFWGKYCCCLAINASGKRLGEALGYPQF